VSKSPSAKIHGTRQNGTCMTASPEPNSVSTASQHPKGSLSTCEKQQDKNREIEFFNSHAVQAEYNVFSDSSNRRLINHCLQMAGLRAPGRMADLGCGSGVFSSLLAEKGFRCVGLDLSHGLTALGRKLYPRVSFLTADVEALPLASASLDGILLSGIVHHLPNPLQCAREVHRVLRPGGVFVAFDPNRLNPFMYVYRDRSSPLYSSKGVTPNERPVLAWQVRHVFSSVGFEVSTGYLSGLSYRYIASPLARIFLPAYNLADATLFALPFLKHFRAFVITAGLKQ